MKRQGNVEVIIPIIAALIDAAATIGAVFIQPGYVFMDNDEPRNTITIRTK